MAGLPGQAFQPGTAAVPSSQVEISVSCRNLKDKDAFSKSDPVCVLFTYDLKGGRYYEFGRTEMIKDSLNPDFVKKFVMNYFFEESQKLKFELYDVDSPSSALTSHDFLGRIECTLGEIVGCGSGTLDRQLIGVAKGSKIIVRAETVGSSKEVMTIQLRGTGLDKKDLFGKSDPFLIFYKVNDDRSFNPVHKTEIIKNTLNPTWQKFTSPLRTICNGDHDRMIKVECYDWDSDGSHDLIGEFFTTVRDLMKAPTANTMFELINPKKKAKKRNYKHSGEIMVMSCKIEVIPTFLDYLQGGLEMNFTVAIDFTASNGNPSSPGSLHYMNPHQPNQYSMAIQAVGEIIQDYDSDKLFPVLGFGGRLPDGKVSFEFPCNFNPTNPYCAGITGIQQAYWSSLQQVQLYGPTNFSPVIKHVSKFAAAKQDGSTYFVLLIITDGVITDLPDTVDAIVRASYLPVSIIIVGVGNAEFDAMDVLDADGQRLRSGNTIAERDIVQFVPFRQFLGSGGGAALSQASLAKAVLAEVPDQVIQYMKRRGFQPRPPRTTPQASSGVQPGQPGAPTGAPQGQQAYPGAPQGQPQGSAPPYQGQTSAGAPPPKPGAPPYPTGGPNPQAGAPPYPAGGANPQAGAPPYPTGGPGQQTGAPPYPTGGPPPYTAGGPAPQGTAPPYPAAGPGGQGATPYPTKDQQGNAPPYPTGGSYAQPSAPYPVGGMVPTGNTPYPTGGQYPQGGAPYPTGATASQNYQATKPPPPQRPPPPNFSK